MSKQLLVKENSREIDEIINRNSLNNPYINKTVVTTTSSDIAYNFEAIRPYIVYPKTQKLTTFKEMQKELNLNYGISKIHLN